MDSLKGLKAGIFLRFSFTLSFFLLPFYRNFFILHTKFNAFFLRILYVNNPEN